VTIGLGEKRTVLGADDDAAAGSDMLRDDIVGKLVQLSSRGSVDDGDGVSGNGRDDEKGEDGYDQ
jgi:hypothetical protein